MVVDPKDVDAFLAYAAEENLEAVTVAEVTESPRLTMTWRGKTIVDLSRAFLDTNGAHQEADVTLTVPNREGTPFERKEVGNVKESWMKMLGSLNVCSQKGLVERFDSFHRSRHCDDALWRKIPAVRDPDHGGKASGIKGKM